MRLCSPDCLICKWNRAWAPPPDKRLVIIHVDLPNMVGIGRLIEGEDEEDEW
jgi:hypothetical protein